MNSRSIFNLCAKVVGLYYALSALDMFLTSISQMILIWDVWNHPVQNDPLGTMVNYKVAVLTSLFIPVLLFGISLLVIFKSEKLSSMLLRDSVDFSGPEREGFSFVALNISVKVFGLFSLLSSVPHLSGLISRLWIMRSEIGLYDNRGKIELVSSGLCALLYMGAGILLLIHSGDIAEKLLDFDIRKKGSHDREET